MTRHPTGSLSRWLARSFIIGIVARRGISGTKVPDSCRLARMVPDICGPLGALIMELLWLFLCFSMFNTPSQQIFLQIFIVLSDCGESLCRWLHA